MARAENWGWRPRCWGWHHHAVGSLIIGELPWSRRWGIQIGIGARKNPPEGEIRWRWYCRWYFPIVRLIRCRFNDSDPSPAWTGRNAAIAGMEIEAFGHRWLWWA